MEIYSSKYLKIQFIKEKSLFIQRWIKRENLTIDLFKIEMLAYTSLYEKYMPNNTIWIQDGFGLELTLNDHQWLEENVNKPCKNYGNKKCAFVVGYDVLAHITVMNSFDEIESCIKPKHFGVYDDAFKWIAEEEEDLKDDFEVLFKGKDESGLNEFIIKTSSVDVKKVLRNIKGIIENEAFIKANIERFLTLTPKEIEVLKQYGTGFSFKQIANTQKVSEYTARTHWRNIKRKLIITSNSDLNNYINAFVK